ncbi:MAG: ASPIC/UnbV domain-containing protein [Planctomycetes bacterium]|nr:ASPIC/UnbV domain-containing protein [Planctomycetota bacterium]
MTARSGLGLPSLKYTGWGVGFHDFNNDGMLDVYIANGAVGRHETPFDPGDLYAEPNLLLRGTGKGRFDVSPSPEGVATRLIGSSRAAAFGDIDNDGDIDIVLVEQNAPARVLRNTVGSRGHWAEFRVRGSQGRDAIGATLKIMLADGTTFYRQVETAYSFSSSNDARVHVGLAAADQIKRVEVTWPGGTREQFGRLPPASLRTCTGQGQRSVTRFGITALRGPGRTAEFHDGARFHTMLACGYSTSFQPSAFCCSGPCCVR